MSAFNPFMATGQKRKKKNLIVHHTLFWLKDPKSVEDKNNLIENLRTLEKIEYHRTLIGVPVDNVEYESTDSSYDVSLVTYFDNVNARIEYQNNPVHKAFIEKCAGLWQKTVSYDTICEIQ
jgi:hypothetical protein